MERSIEGVAGLSPVKPSTRAVVNPGEPARDSSSLRAAARARFLLRSSGPVAHRGPPHLPPPLQARAAERATAAALGAGVCEWGASRDGSLALTQGGTGPMGDAMA